MKRAIGVALFVVGVMLLIWGINTSNSLASELSEFFTGSPTNRAMWLIAIGIIGSVVGFILAALPGRRDSRF